MLASCPIVNLSCLFNSSILTGFNGELLLEHAASPLTLECFGRRATQDLWWAAPA
jgi:hypothetical protein